MITTYEFVRVQKAVFRLINDYKTVNDTRVLAVSKTIAFDKILDLLPGENESVQIFLAGLSQRDLTRQRADKLFELLIPFVTPFPTFSDKQLKKLFPKVKKLKQPDTLNTATNTTYLGWDDKGNQRKYLIMPTENGYLGLVGETQPNIVHGLCAICHEFSNVVSFTSLVKGNAQGNYTKKGNYICADSQWCNQHLDTLIYLERFVAHVRPQK
jgi:hypothetical protein